MSISGRTQQASSSTAQWSLQQCRIFLPPVEPRPLVGEWEGPRKLHLYTKQRDMLNNFQFTLEIELWNWNSMYMSFWACVWSRRIISNNWSDLKRITPPGCLNFRSSPVLTQCAMSVCSSRYGYKGRSHSWRYLSGALRVLLVVGVYVSIMTRGHVSETVAMRWKGSGPWATCRSVLRIPLHWIWSNTATACNT